MLNPCCCISPRVGTLIFGVLNFVFALYRLADDVRVILDGRGGHFDTWVELGLAVLLIFLALLLIFGALKKEAEKIRLWLILMICYIVCSIILSVLDVYQHSTTAAFGYKDGSRFGGLILFIYQVWVVYAYLHELRYGPGGLTYCPAQVV